MESEVVAPPSSTSEGVRVVAPRRGPRPELARASAWGPAASVELALAPVAGVASAFVMVDNSEENSFVPVSAHEVAVVEGEPSAVVVWVVLLVWARAERAHALS